MKIAVVTDSNSGIFEEKAREMGVYTVPMPFCIDDSWVYEGVNLTTEEFFSKQQAGAKISTSQPTVADVGKLWVDLLQDYDSIVYIPMTSGLSGSCQTAKVMADDFEDRVQVVDNRRISVTQRQSVQDALKLVEKGFGAKEVKEQLEKHALDASIYVTVDTLKYLKQGGRITPAAAAIGTVLNIKPVLQIQGGKIDAYAKVRGMHQAVSKMTEALKNDMKTKFDGMNLHVCAAWSGNDQLGREWCDYVQKQFPEYELQKDPLSLSIACHTGPGAVGIGCVRYEE